MSTRRRAADQFFSPMKDYLLARFGAHMTHVNLLKFALSFAEDHGIKVDRDARRKKELLIVWFCENALDLLQTSPVASRPILEESAANDRATSTSESTSLFELFGRSKELILEEEELLRWA
jgi:hypothetical protein